MSEQAKRRPAKPRHATPRHRFCASSVRSRTDTSILLGTHTFLFSHLPVSHATRHGRPARANLDPGPHSRPQSQPSGAHALRSPALIPSRTPRQKEATSASAQASPAPHGHDPARDPRNRVRRLRLGRRGRRRRCPSGPPAAPPVPCKFDSRKRSGNTQTAAQTAQYEHDRQLEWPRGREQVGAEVLARERPVRRFDGEHREPAPAAPRAGVRPREPAAAACAPA